MDGARFANAVASLGCTPAETTKQDSINRGLTYYNDHLAESLPQEYARVLSPLHQLIGEILERGKAEGTFRPDLQSETTAALIMQAVLGAMGEMKIGGALPMRRAVAATRQAISPRLAISIFWNITAPEVNSPAACFACSCDLASPQGRWPCHLGWQ